MATIKMPYGHTAFDLELADSQILANVQSNALRMPRMRQHDIIAEALAQPIDSPRLAELVKKGEKICLLVPDITRIWQSPEISVPLVVEELNEAGIADEDITILFANGTHRRMTPAERASLVSLDIAKRIRMLDHQSKDRESLRKMGITSRGTPVYFNRHAVEADKIVSICGAVYHFLAGFGGGGKMLLPGIAGEETIQANHSLALNHGFGSGMNINARSGNYGPDNPFHADIFEAAAMLPPAFSLNVVADDNGNIIKAFAGDWRKAHAQACQLVARQDGVEIPHKAGFVIASAGGSPKDINLYQGVKTITNAVDAARPGAVIIALMECPEGFGNEDTKRLMRDLETMEAREKSLREEFSIGAFAGYFVANAGEQYKLILVTEMDAKDFVKTKIRVAHDLHEAMRMALQMLANQAEPCIVMPHGATTLPMPAEQKA